jgi:hypothetical protein
MKRIIHTVLLLAFLASPAGAGETGGAIPQILNPDVGAAAVPDLKGKVHLQVRVSPPQAGNAIADIVGVRFLPSAAGTPDIGGDDYPLGPPHARFTLLQEDAARIDGFDLFIDTALLPAGRYTLVLSAFDHAYREIGRSWKPVRLPGCEIQPGTAPWPLMLPSADGAQSNPGIPANALTIEFAEPLLSVSVTVNGLPALTQPWTPPRRDHDTIPGQRILEDVYGQGILVRNLLPGARVKVVGTDLSNTKATKEVVFQP